MNWVCGMGAPSSGGIAVAQTLGILENFDLAALRPTAIDLEGGKPTVQGVHLVGDPLVAGLRALGHATVNVTAQSSGVSTIVRTNIGGAPSLSGGADPRREGLALGDSFVIAP